ncbi:CAP domain-containing protein [Halobacillus shinanisalinarum]|uniref:CAP domain-containing protein n=1 Tax=Halobacillus shinanisalinarum TaxID=2932258 RepID=A0ABY4H4A6_9BACI|nr:CAP domain-containing protein [Halobacillus shinanisalinarum]UOQ95290.1 CAP domain-containing protein [Halobacillus shinanisalinarum]
MLKRYSFILVAALAIISISSPASAQEQGTWKVEQVDTQSVGEWTTNIQEWLSEQNLEFSKERFQQNFKVLFNPEQIPADQQPSQPAQPEESTQQEQPAAQAPQSGQGSTEASPAPSEVEANATSSYEEEVVQLVNEERAKEGLAPLEMHNRLSDLARMKSQDMADKGYFSHTSPTYGSPFDMMKQYDFSYSTAGENIAAGQRTPQEVVEGWMNSPGHRENIMNESFTHIGVGYVEGGSYGTYWTQLFMTPR